MPLLDVNGISLHYQLVPALSATAAGRPPLLMLAGMASDGASWQPVIDPLRQHHSLLIPDNRCSGQSRLDPLVCSRESMVADILGLLDTLGIAQVNVLGHSMGGMLGWALACQAPSRVLHLISAAALPQISPARIALFRSMLRLRSDSNEADWFTLLYQFLFRPDFFDDPDRLAATLAASITYPYKQDLASFSAQVAALDSFLPALPLQDMRCPVTMLTGSQDVLTTPHMLGEFRRQHPEVNACIIENAAHALHWEQPLAFAEIVEQALVDQNHA